MAANILHTIFIMWQEPLFYTSFSIYKSYFHQTDLTNIITFILKTNVVQQSEGLTSNRREVLTPANQSADSSGFPHTALPLSELEQYPVCGSSPL